MLSNHSCESAASNTRHPILAQSNDLVVLKLDDTAAVDLVVHAVRRTLELLLKDGDLLYLIEAEGGDIPAINGVPRA
jgi:hypothetical protein